MIEGIRESGPQVRNPRNSAGGAGALGQGRPMSGTGRAGPGFQQMLEKDIITKLRNSI